MDDSPSAEGAAEGSQGLRFASPLIAAYKEIAALKGRLEKRDYETIWESLLIIVTSSFITDICRPFRAR